MAAQTSMSASPAEFIAGMLYDTRPTNVIQSRAIEDAAGATPGRVYVEGATHQKTCKAPAAAGDVAFPVGVALYSPTNEPNAPNYEQYDMVPLLSNGVVPMECSGTISDGETALFLVHTGADAGLFSETDDGSTTALPAGCFVRCLKGGDDGDIGLFEIKFSA